MNWEVTYFPEYWDGKRLAFPHVPKESPKFARSMVVGNLVFVSGCTGQDTITCTGVRGQVYCLNMGSGKIISNSTQSLFSILHSTVPQSCIIASLCPNN